MSPTESPIAVLLGEEKDDPNWSELLGLGLEDIKNKYRRQSLLTHPDK